MTFSQHCDQIGYIFIEPTMFMLKYLEKNISAIPYTSNGQFKSVMLQNVQTLELCSIGPPYITCEYFPSDLFILNVAQLF